MKGRTNITSVDIKMYNLLFEAVSAHPGTLGKLIPTFLINESIFFLRTVKSMKSVAPSRSFLTSTQENA